MSSLSEFELIERFFSPLAKPFDDRVMTGLGDDCAVVKASAQELSCFSIDTMVEGVHFPKNAPPELLAYRCLAAAVSDLAAMGATPAFFTLALTLPHADPKWLEGFSRGLKHLIDRYQMPLLGGDTTKGPLTLSIQVHGRLSQSGLLRSGARVGDIVAVSGTLGDAGAALDLLDLPYSKDLSGSSDPHAFLLSRYYQPTPRIELGQTLLSLASSCIDISDGLLAEAMHISEKSKVCLDLISELIPLSEALVATRGLGSGLKLALNSGDDYELLFTLPESNWSSLVDAVGQGLVTPIGRVIEGAGVRLDGVTIDRPNIGFQHFV